MPRRGALHEVDAQEALLSALMALGIEAEITAGEPAHAEQPGFLIRVGESVLLGDVKSVVTGASAEQLVRRAKRLHRPAIVVADRIAEDAKASMRKAGLNYLDRRGELRLFEGSLKVDARVPASIGSAPQTTLSSQVAREVAIACLLEPDQPHGVRQVATYIDRVPSAVSGAMAGLREAGLLTSRGEPAVPDLFHELSARWRRRPVPLIEVPRPGRGATNAQLELGLEDPETSIGWTLTDTLAAAAWGMPVVARGDYPPDFYVPTASVLRRAVGLLGEAHDASRRACTVAIAPVRLVCLRRHDRSQTGGEVWPVSSHIVVALDIATDKARGLEILEQWRPEGIVRAW